MGGRYFEDCNEAQLLHQNPPLLSGGAAPFALDPANAELLWEMAEGWMGVDGGGWRVRG